MTGLGQQARWQRELSHVGTNGSRRERARARRHQPEAVFDVLEERRLLATLDFPSPGSLSYTATAVASDLTVSTTGPSGAYTFTDTNQTITLTAAAMTAGWTGSGTNTVTGPDSSVTGITISTGAADDTIAINSVDASTFIDSGAGSDTINVTANGIAAAAIVTIDSSSNSGSESLTIDTGGTPGTFATGAFGRENYQAAGQGLIENASSKPGFGDSLTGVGDGALTVNLNTLFTTPTALSTTISESAGELEAAVAGVITRFFPIADLASVSVGGTTAGENLTLDYTNGDPLPSSGLTYDPPAAGANASNVLTLQSGSGGTTFTSEAYTAIRAGTGTIVYSDSTHTNVPITFSHLSPVTDTVPSPAFIIAVPAVAITTVNFNTGPLIGGTQTDQINAGGTGAFELINFANKTAVTLDVNDAGATTTLNYPSAAAGLSALNVVSGAGNETVDVQTSATGVTTTVDTGSGSGSTTNVGLAGSLAAILGNVFAKSTGGSNTLAIDDSADGAANTYDIIGSEVSATTFPAVIDFSGGGITTLDLTSPGAGDTFNFIGPVQSAVTTYNFSADGGPGPNTLNVTSSVPQLSYTGSGVLGFGTGLPVINYTNFQTINVRKPATPPTGTGATITANEGQSLSNVVVATFSESDLGNVTSDFTATINWGDGTAASIGTIQASGANDYSILGSHTYGAAGTYTVTATLTDLGSSGTTTVAGTTINVTSTGPVPSSPSPIASTASVGAAPLIAQGATVTGNEGIALNPALGGDVLVATFMDTGTVGTPAAYTATIDWGDGTSSADTRITSQGTANGVVFSVFGNHTYAEEGTYSTTVTITKTASGSTAIALGQAVIADAALTAGAPVALTPSTGAKLTNTIVGTFTDANTGAAASDFTATIDWGDGTATSPGTIVATTPAGTFEVEGTHAYANPGSYATKIVVDDVGGSTVTLPGSAVVTDPALTGTTNAIAAVEGISTGTIVLATITDPNTLATASNLSATVNWGDGTGTVPAVVTLIGTTSTSTIFDVTGSHTYADEGTDSVSVAVTTTGGATTTPSPLTDTATVADAPITASGSSISGIEGTSTGSVIIATFSDANPGATVADFTTGTGSIVVNWGDGSAPETLPASAVTSSGSVNGVLFTVTAAHTYAEEGHDQLTVAITDDGGAKASANGSATIADAALTPSIAQPMVSTTEAVVFTGAVASFTDGNPTAPSTDYTYVTIDWGDGTPDTAGSISQPGGVGTAFLVSGTHTYADAGVNGGIGHYTITVDVRDVGGASAMITNVANVADVALIVTGKLNPASDSGVSDTDDITKVVQPNFLGTTNQPDATISLYATASGSTTPVLIGTGTSDASGAWSITSDQALADGAYAITAIAVDSSGHTISTTTTVVPDLVIDTVGPKVTGVQFDRIQGQIVVTFQDYGGVNNTGVGLNEATVIDANNYQLVTVHHPRVGKYRVNVISDTPGTTSGTQTVTLTINGGKYIKGGWYFFTIRSVSPSDLTGVEDIAGNALDGEFYGFFPSGNNQPGGDFVAQLTAIHHTIFAPSTIIGRATPVSPPGTRPGSVFIPETINPSKLAHVSTSARARAARNDSVRLVHHSDRLSRQNGSTMFATAPAASSASQATAMGALSTLDQALDQLGKPKHHQS